MDSPLLEMRRWMRRPVIADLFAAFLAAVMVLANSVAYCGIVASGGFLSEAFGAFVQQAVLWQGLGSVILLPLSKYLTIAAVRYHQQHMRNKLNSVSVFEMHELESV